jgi:hypothetical protein
MTTGSQDVEAVRATVLSIAHHIDRRRWEELRALFAPEVSTDYTSLFGGEPQTQASSALVEGWRGILGRVATQHLLGPIAVHAEGSEAHASCHVRAFHHAPNAPGGSTWEVLGHYAFELRRAGAGWTITRMSLETFAQTGNTKLLSEERAA